MTTTDENRPRGSSKRNEQQATHIWTIPADDALPNRTGEAQPPATATRRLPSKQLVIFILSCTACAMDIYTVFEPGAPTLPALLALLITCLLTLAIPLSPLAIGITLMLTYSMVSLTHTSMGIVTLTMPAGLWLATGVVFSNAWLWFAALIGVATVALNYIATRLASGDMSALVTVCAFMALAAAAGLLIQAREVAARRHAREEQALRDREKAKRMERDISLARHMHDSLTNDLTSIIMVCESEKTNEDSRSHSGDAASWSFVKDRAINALACAHQVIDVLRSSELGKAAPLPEQKHRQSEDIRLLLRERQSDLRKEGFEGTVSLSIVNDSAMPAHVFSELDDLLNELFNNIVRHSARGDDGYFLSVAVEDHIIEITEMNKVLDTGSNTRQARGIVSGRGLSLHRKTISALGGTLRTTIDDSTWTCYATLPRNPNGTDGATQHDAI